jgi:hypothetical protein
VAGPNVCGTAPRWSIDPAVGDQSRNSDCAASFYGVTRILYIQKLGSMHAKSYAVAQLVNSVRSPWLREMAKAHRFGPQHLKRS